MRDLDLVNVSRLQFAVTALYHFLFVPPTLGLSRILVIGIGLRDDRPRDLPSIRMVKWRLAKESTGDRFRRS
jgi:hypothetical protein